MVFDEDGRSRDVVGGCSVYPDMERGERGRGIWLAIELSSKPPTSCSDCSVSVLRSKTPASGVMGRGESPPEAMDISAVLLESRDPLRDESSVEPRFWLWRIGDRKPVKSENMARDPRRAYAGPVISDPRREEKLEGAKSWVRGDEEASVLDCEEASSRRPPTSQKETWR